MHSVVVVESPSKAKTINKYLGSDYTVLASFGHVRDLPSKDGSVKPDDDFAMTYVVEDDSKRHVSAIAKAVKKADMLLLATDPDREGEAISWHVLEALKLDGVLHKGLGIKRVVFNEITKKAVTDAIKAPRDIDMALVNAQQARRALDYLVGFTLSPVLWRKLPGARSAGRVQSVALRIICDRDEEIEKFISEEYWDIKATLNHPAQPVKARLTHYQGKKLEKFSIPNEAEASRITESLKGKNFTVSKVDPKQARRNPYAPFTTSTLQQEAARKLGFSAKKTMQTAQKLYEGIDIGGETVGLITYMRTDGVYVAQEAIQATRSLIGKSYGNAYLPEQPKYYKVKTTNAQEAHEAVRPTDVNRLPKDMERYLENDMLRLYELVWKRLVASQMESAVFDQVSVDFVSSDNIATLRANGSVMKFDGFLKLYQEGKDDDGDEDDESRLLPPMKEGDALAAKEILPEQHFTEPPPRFTEASLVKKLEELGIGRPSTYASIISVLQDRTYVRLDKKRFIAEPRGRIVNAFLVSFFKRYVEFDFTAKLEEELDEVSEGKMDWKTVLRNWWAHFILTVNSAKEVSNPDVLIKVDELLESFIFRNSVEGKDPRACPTCADGRLGLKTGKFGAFLGCSNYPTCNYTKEITTEEGQQDAGGAGMANETDMGVDPKTGLPVLLKKGPYGWYVQLGNDKKPKRASLPKGLPPEQLSFDAAISLLALPRDVGAHPESGKMITAGNGRFGPYILHDGAYTSLKGEDDVLTIGINRAVDLIATSAAKRAANGSAALRTIGNHPDSDKPIQLFSGKYGHYIKSGKLNLTLPKSADPEKFSLEEALALIESKGGGKKPAKGKAKKAAAEPKGKKPAVKKVAAKKPAAKKTAAPKKKAVG